MHLDPATLDIPGTGRLVVDQRSERAFAFGGHDVRVFDITHWHAVRTMALALDEYPMGIVDERAGRVLVVNTGRKVVPVLDARTGALLYTLHVGNGPAWPVLDERSGRAYLIIGDKGTSNHLRRVVHIPVRTEIWQSHKRTTR